MYALRRTISRDENYRMPSYISRCDLIGIETLARRRINACAFFVFDLLSERYDAPNLLSQVTINRSTRNPRLPQFLNVQDHRTDYGQYEPINNMCMKFNQFSHLYTAGMSRDVFRTKVKAMKLPVKLNDVLRLT